MNVSNRSLRCGAPPGRARRNAIASLVWLGGAAFLGGCQATDPMHPGGPGNNRAREATVHLDVAPLDHDGSLARVELRTTEARFTTDARHRWVVGLPESGLRSELRIRARGGHRRYFATRIGPDELSHSPVRRLPLLPKRALTVGDYADRLDLLQRFLQPLSGSKVLHLEELPIRIALPDRPPTDVYREECRQAIAEWNRLLGARLWLVAVGPQDSAAVRCTVADDIALAFTRILARDARGVPSRLRVHVSPRFHPDYPRYVRRAWMHELGHVLGLWGHSQNLEHLMNGRAVIVDAPHPDEIDLVRLLHALPVGYDLRWVQRPWRRGAPGDLDCARALLDAPLPR